MTYDELLKKIKEVFIAKLFHVVNENAYKANPKLTKEVYIDTIYTDIRALGYNFGDLKKATEDIYELQNGLPWFEGVNDLKLYIQRRIEETSQLYPEEIKAFSIFHERTQNGEDFEKVLENIKSLLN